MGRGQGRVFRRTWRDATGKLRRVVNYTLEYSVGGTQYRENSGTSDRRAALDMLRQRVGDRKAGRVVGNPDKVTLHQLREMLEAHYRTQGHKSTERMLRVFDLHLERVFVPGTRARDVTRARVAQYVAARLAEGAARDSVKYEVAVLNSAFGVAVEAEVLAVYPSFKLPTGSPARAQFFEAEEFGRLLLALASELRPIVASLYIMGWRSTELRLLKWDAVDWEAQEIRLDAKDSKNREARTFPFAHVPELRQILDGCWKNRYGGEYVFGWAKQPHGKAALVYGWNKACRLAKCEGMLVHDLRRTAARNFRRAGVDEATTMRLLGWRSAAVFRAYSITDSQDVADAMKKRFKSLVSGQGPESPDKA